MDTRLSKKKEAVVKAAMRWYRSYVVGLDLAKMGAPAYLHGASADANHQLLKACHAALTRKRK